MKISERRHRWPIGAKARVALVLATAACATNPVTGKSELSLISESQEIEMGKQAAEEVRQSTPLVESSELQSYVSGIGVKLGKASERPNLPWTYQVVDDPSVNAFALPGGPIFVTRGILAYMQNEAELATVLGHETGHVAAKHSVHQISQQQVYGGLLGIGSILSSQVAAVAGIASQGLGLLFLKYSRDAETQADDLGFRYALNGGYDVRYMRTMFQMLDRISSAGGEGRLPQWLSTHPDPGNRIAKTDERLKTVTTDLSRAKVNRDQFIRLQDGLVFGENPRLGYFEGTRFFHPELTFRIDFPAGWTTQNQASAVLAVSKQQDAVITLSIVSKQTPDQALSAFIAQQGIQASGSARETINGIAAVGTDFRAQTQDGQQVAGRAVFLSHGGNTYQLLGYSTAAAYSDYRPTFIDTFRSFARLTDPNALNKQPMRIKLVRIPRDMTIDDLSRQYPSAVPVTTLAFINGKGSATEVLKAGDWAKTVK